MFGRYHKTLTEMSNYYIDWSRAAELIASGHHRYSRKELQMRACIIALTAASGCFGAYLNNRNTTGMNNVTAATLSTLLGFALSHSLIANVPLSKKRYAMHQQCNAIITQIHKHINDHQPQISENIRKLTDQMIDKIMAISLANENHDNASQTWGYRLRLLTNLNEHIHQKTYLDLFENRSADDMLNLLTADMGQSKSPSIP